MIASGGFQVEEYARLHFSDGELIDDPYDGDNYQWFHDKTKELLQKKRLQFMNQDSYMNFIC